MPASESSVPLQPKTAQKKLSFHPCVQLLAVLALAGSVVWVYLRAVHGLVVEPSIVEADGAPVEFSFPPTDLSQVQSALTLLRRRSDEQWLYIFLLYCFGYLIKQSFALPGSALMNVLGGALYGHLPAVVIVSILTAVGSTFCYLLSWFVAGEALLNRWASKRLHQFRRRIKKYEQGNDLFFYLLFMRLGIPVRLFFLSILVGLAPYNFITTGAGNVLTEINSLADIMRPSTLLKLIMVAFVVLSMPLLKHRFAPKQEEQNEDDEE